MSPNVTDSRENRMDVHDNARLTPRGREALVRAVVDHGLTKAEAARRFNTTAKTVTKWVQRFCAEGVAGYATVPPAPISCRAKPRSQQAMPLKPLRRQRHTQAAIAQQLGLSQATASRILRRRGLSLLAAIEPVEPRPRYERQTPGEIVHIDIKKGVSEVLAQEMARSASRY
jgi:transposase